MKCSRGTWYARRHDGHYSIARCYLSGHQHLPDGEEDRALTLTGDIFDGIISRVAIVIGLVEHTSQTGGELVLLGVDLRGSHVVEKLQRGVDQVLREGVRRDLGRSEGMKSTQCRPGQAIEGGVKNRLGREACTRPQT